MYAIVKTGGKQYRVEEGRALNVERLPAEEGERVELSDVLLIADDGDVTVGTPTIDGARVVAEVEANGRDKKIIVFKYKAKVRTRKKTGHRQSFTRLVVQQILRPGEEPKAAPKKRRAKKEEAPEAEAEAVEAAEAAVEAPAAEAPVEEKPRRRTRKKADAPAAEAKTEEKPKTRARKKAEEPKAKAEEKPKRRTRKKKDEE